MNMNQDNRDRLRVVAAAIRHDGVVYTGSRHAEIIRYMVKDLQVTDKVLEEQQGFVTADGRWKPRRVARECAILSGQIDKDHGILTSEDLWKDVTTSIKGGNDALRVEVAGFLHDYARDIAGLDQEADAAVARFEERVKIALEGKRGG